MNFSIGDVVILKSGGPAMTVENIGDYGGEGQKLMCTWFEEKKKVSAVFHPNTVEIAGDF